MKFLRLCISLTLVFGLLLLITGHCYADKDLEDNRQELAKIRKRIDELAASLEQGQKKKGALENDLKGLGQQLTRLRAREARHSNRLHDLKREIVSKETAIEDLRSATRKRKELVARRLAAIYRSGQMGWLKLLFADRSPHTIAEDYHLFKRVVQHDRQLLAAFRQDREAIAQELAALENLRNKRQQQVEELQASRQTLQQGRRLKKRLLSKLQRRQGAMSDEIASLKEKSARLAKLVKSLESAPASKYTQTFGDFAAQKGRLLWPVKGLIKVPFGTGRVAGLGTLYDSQGIEIKFDGNQSIQAIWGGRVIYANRFRGYGNMIIVDHGDSFYSLYAQASSLQKKVGDPVETGELLGYPGFEDADSVYFEIRHHGTPLDPLTWLKPRS